MKFVQLITKIDNIFDQHIERHNTDCVKYDGLSRYFELDNNQAKLIKPLWVADMDFQSPINITNAIQDRVSHQIFGYGEYDDSYYNSVINWYQYSQTISIQKDELIFSPSVLASLSTCIESFTDKNDEIIVQSPVYYPFYSLVKSANRKLVLNPLQSLNKTENHYSFDLKHFKSLITSKTKMLILCSPHNPIGRVWKKNELEKLIKICNENNIIIVSDEIHSDLAFTKFTSMYELYHNSIILNSPSKTFNLAGLSSSYVIIQNQDLMQRFKTTFESRAYNNNIIGMLALREAYSSDISKHWLEVLKKYLLANIELTHKYLRDTNISFVSPEASYLLWLDMSKLNLSNKIIQDKLLYECNLALNNGISFGKEGKGYFRLNIALPRDELKTSLKQLQSQLLSSLG